MSDWRSPHENPGRCGATAIRVLVKIERYPNPPALNAPDDYAFGHRIYRNDAPKHWPKDGWFIHGKGDEYRVVGWKYIETPEGELDPYTIEQCAQVIEGGRCNVPSHYSAQCPQAIAAAIRALGKGEG